MDSYGSIHILRKLFFYQLQHFHEFFEYFSSSLCTKNFKLQHEIFCQNVMLKKNSFVLMKKFSFCENFGSQIKFCAVQVLT